MAQGTPTFAVQPLASPAAASSGEPRLTIEGDRTFLSWIETSETKDSLEFAERTSSGWSTPLPIVSGTNLMVNAADVPSVHLLANGALVAQWLQEHGADPEAYDLQLSRSADGGRTWTPPSSPHHDGTASQHGFASLFPVPDPVTPNSSSTSTTTRPPPRPGIYSVIGLDVFTAVQSLTQDGYRVVLVRAPSRRYPPNYVTAQDPAAGASVRSGATITLTVANGRPRVLIVPNVLGLLADQAAAKAREAGFIANVVVAAEPPPGTVGNAGKAWKQSPISGSNADEGSTITVWVNP